MASGETLEKIRSIWLTQIVNQVAHGERVRANFLVQLETVFDLMRAAVDQKNAALLDPLLDDWANNYTQTEVDALQNSLTPLLNQMLVVTFQVARQNLSLTEAPDLLDALLPVFTHAIERAAECELKHHIHHIRLELDQTRAKMERIEKSKSDFISVAAHELKTPLTLIEGYSSMLRETLPEECLTQTQADRYTRGINLGTQRMGEIVDAMIDVSMIDNNLLSLSFQPVWINRMVGSIARELSEILSQRKLSLHVKRFPGSEEMFFADSERIYQALRNVISNAVKYTPDGGSIFVDGRLLPGFIEILVKDSGIGIDPDDHARIFEKFGRLGDASLHSSGKTKFKGGGPGLGLPITKGIIEAHGGAIWVESSGYDEKALPGSTFHIMIPLRKSPPDEKSAKLFRGLTEPQVFISD